MQKSRLRFFISGFVLSFIGSLCLIFGIILLTASGPRSKNLPGTILTVAGGIGMVAAVYLLIKAQKPISPPGGPTIGTMLEEEKTPVDVSTLQAPEEIRMETRPDELHFSYSRFNKPAYLLLFFGPIFALLGIIFLLAEKPIEGVTGVAGGLFFIYIFLVVLVNRQTVQVKRDTLKVWYGPLPWSKGYILPCKDLLQLYTFEEVIYSKDGQTVTYALKAIMSDGRHVRLLWNKSVHPIRYLVVRIEQWLGITDKKVSGEVA
ncbi:hypothetical protein EG832_21055 [bacterium]|nr:hypothetical protein [bacterium]